MAVHGPVSSSLVRVAIACGNDYTAWQERIKGFRGKVDSFFETTCSCPAPSPCLVTVIGSMRGEYLPCPSGGVLVMELLAGRASRMAETHQKFAEGLEPEEKMLIVLRDDLYGSSWDRMLADLKDRLDGRPYIFKLHNRIKEDMRRIEKLRQYEERHGVNLADYIKGGES